MRRILAAVFMFWAGLCHAETTYYCECFESCLADWTTSNMVTVDCDLSNTTGSWSSALIDLPGLSDYLITLEVYTGDETTVYLRAMSGASAFFVASATTQYAVLNHFGTENSGTLFGPGPLPQSWWKVQFGSFDGRLVYRHWLIGNEAPDFVSDNMPTDAQGPLEIQAYSGVESARIRNVHVQGAASVAAAAQSWGSTKAAYR